MNVYLFWNKVFLLASKSYFYVVYEKIYSLSFSLEGVSSEVFSRVFIASEDVEVVSVDLDVTTDW